MAICRPGCINGNRHDSSRRAVTCRGVSEGQNIGIQGRPESMGVLIWPTRSFVLSSDQTKDSCAHLRLVYSERPDHRLLLSSRRDSGGKQEELVAEIRAGSYISGSEKLIQLSGAPRCMYDSQAMRFRASRVQRLAATERRERKQ